MLKTIYSQQIPLLKIASLFAAGIAISSHFLPLFSSLVIRNIALATMAAILVLYHLSSIRPSGKIGFIWVAVFLFGCFVIASTDIQKNTLIQNDSYFLSNAIKGIELTSIRETQNSFAAEGRIVLLDSGKTEQIRRSNCKAIIYLKKGVYNSALQPGALLLTPQKFISLQPDPSSEFYNYDQYLISKGINYRVFLNESEQFSIEQDYQYSFLYVVRYRIRQLASSILEKRLSPQSNSVAQALVLGKRSYLDKDLKAQFARSGIIHILAVSGLHVSFVVYVLFSLLNILFRRSRKYSAGKVVFLIIVLLFYAELTGGAPPVWRASIMTVTFLIAKCVDKKFSTLNIVGLAAMILLIYNPSQLFTPSFQLSFVAVMGIMVFFPFLSRIWPTNNFVLRRVRDIISVGVAAQLATFPIALYHFEQVSLASPLSGLFAIPLAAAILWGGVVIILFCWLPEIVLSLVARGLEFIISTLVNLSSTLAEFPLSTWAGYEIRPVEALLFLSIVILISFYLHTKRSIVLFAASVVFLLQSIVHRFYIFYPTGL